MYDNIQLNARTRNRKKYEVKFRPLILWPGIRVMQMLKGACTQAALCFKGCVSDEIADSESLHNVLMVYFGANHQCTVAGLSDYAATFRNRRKCIEKAGCPEGVIGTASIYMTQTTAILIL